MFYAQSTIEEEEGQVSIPCTLPAAIPQLTCTFPTTWMGCRSVHVDAAVDVNILGDDLDTATSAAAKPFPDQLVAIGMTPKRQLT